MQITEPIPGYGNRYHISRDGRVWSNVTMRWMALQWDRVGYQSVALTLRDGSGKKQRHLVHRLVAAAFIPNPNSKPTVNHKDGDKANNKDTNLEWATHSENHRHAYAELGRAVSTVGLRDSSRPCVCTDARGESYYTSARAAASARGLKEKGVARACRGERKSYAGVQWRYV